MPVFSCDLQNSVTRRITVCIRGTLFSCADAHPPGQCTAGYACPAGSMNSTSEECPPGHFSLSGAGECSACAAGRFSNATARSEECEDLCPPGHECPVASRLASPCAAGKYSPSEGFESCGTCSAAPGFSCPSGSTSAAGVKCPDGMQSAGGSALCYRPSAGILGPVVGGVVGGVGGVVLLVACVVWFVRRRVTRRAEVPPVSPPRTGPLLVEVQGQSPVALQGVEHIPPVAPQIVAQPVGQGAAYRLQGQGDHGLIEYSVDEVQAALRGLESAARGGFGVVYRASLRGQQVAVKTLRHDVSVSPCSGVPSGVLILFVVPCLACQGLGLCDVHVFEMACRLSVERRRPFAGSWLCYPGSTTSTWCRCWELPGRSHQRTACGVRLCGAHVSAHH